MYKLLFYKLPSGKCPTKEFLSSTNAKIRSKIMRDIFILQEYGPNLYYPHCRYMDDGLFELRIVQANQKARIFYFFVENREIVLLNGFIKKSDKTPINQLEKARKYKKDYESRKEETL